MNKDQKFVLCFVLLFSTNALALYAHNRLNTFLYLLLLGLYLLLNCPHLLSAKPQAGAAALRKLFFNFQTKQAVLSWFFCIYAPVFLALYYLNFKLLLLNLALNALFSTGAWLLKNKE